MSNITTDCASGQWVGPETFRLPDGRVAVTDRYLSEHFRRDDGKPVIDFSFWHKWGKVPCPDLNPAINGGKLQAWRARRPPDYKTTRPITTVFLLSECEEIIRRRTEPKARKTSPGGVKFIDGTGQAVKHPQYGVCISDARAIEQFGRPATKFSSYWRRHAHPALDRVVNGGKAQAIQAAPLRVMKGSRPTYFTSLDDLERIVEWEERLQTQGVVFEDAAVEAKGPVPLLDIANRMNLASTKEREALSVALRRFRADHPQASCRRFSCTHPSGRPKRRFYGAWVYDFEQFKAWLAGRNIITLADELRSRLVPVRLAKAVMFLQYAMTHPVFERQRFRRFLNNPPVGKVLMPVPGGVRLSVIKKWSREAKVSRVMRRLAKQELRQSGVRIHYRRDGKGGQYLWTLGSPIICGPRLRELARELKKKRGPKPKQQVADRNEACYRIYMSGIKMTLALRQAAKDLGEAAPKKWQHLKIYAERHANADPANPLPMDRKPQNLCGKQSTQI